MNDRRFGNTAGVPGDASSAEVPDLPRTARACLFDLDGVITRTAGVHEAAWTAMFDAFLRERDADARLFSHSDYEQYVDGRPRADGVRAFLASRGIELPLGDDDDPPGTPTVIGLGRSKNERFSAELTAHGVEVYEGSVRFVRAVRRAGMRTAVVSSSANAALVLAAARIADLFDSRIDGITARECHLHGKPAPDTFLAGARSLGVTARSAVVFEDALAGVEAGRAGHFGLVVGVDRDDQHDALMAHGADVVVRDLAELLHTP
jgi:beta-phosphoglucomutase family hydrolase